MSSSTDKQSQALRDSAAALLQKAAHCSDPARRDTLTREALVQIEEARRLLDEVRAVTPHSDRRLH